MMVVVEFKNLIDSDNRLHSDLVAQVIAEADAADLFQPKCPIHWSRDQRNPHGWQSLGVLQSRLFPVEDFEG